MNFQLNSVDDRTKVRFSALSSSLEGAEAIFVERPLVAHVRVTDICHDDWGVRLTITDLLKPGMHRLRNKVCSIAATWQIFSFSAGDWQAHYIPWKLFFDPTVIRGCGELGDAASQSQSMVALDDARQIFTEYYLRISKK